MNILRTIKLKHLNGEFDNMTKNEKLFLALFDGAIEKNFGNSIHILKDDKTLFTIRVSSGSFWCEYDSYLSYFKKENQMDYKRLEKFINHILHEHFGFENLVYSQFRPAGVYTTEIDISVIKMDNSLVKL